MRLFGFFSNTVYYIPKNHEKMYSNERKHYDYVFRNDMVSHDTWFIKVSLVWTCVL